jgi:hypothetical protein
MFKPMTLIAIGCLCAGSAWAQTRVMSGGHGVGAGRGEMGRTAVPSGSRTAGVRISGNGVERRGLRRTFRGAGFFGDYGWPYSYDDYAGSYEPETAAAAQPAPAAAAQLMPEPVPDPLLLELRGDQWVRVESFTSSVPSKSSMVVSPVVAGVSAPAVLVYRDGHREELNSYSIIGPVIYAKGDYWSSGNWTRKIQIADLDLPSTFKQNQDRGVKFELPSGPNEVMIRP